ncbi:MAG TPA: DUF6492 family protein [Rhabdochlamydiaceae bacterium]|nr:DUF6492 family protein [Rhabdochlamydiaceae bacterium]
MKRLLIILCFIVQMTAYAFDKVQYTFDPAPIDVIIPCTDKDIPTLDLCIDGIRKNGRGIRRVIVVSAKRLTEKAEWFNERNYPFTPFDLALEIFRNHANAASSAHAYVSSKKTRVGWIYQQFLKFYAPFVIPDLSSNILILDADTIFLNPVSFLGDQGQGLYNPGTEHHFPYFELMGRLIPGLKKVFPKLSGISHHMLFQKTVLKDLLYTIESIHQIDAWKAICRCIDHRFLYEAALSEYEIYFNFVFTRSDQMKVRYLKWTNIQKIEDIRKYKKRGYHYVSCHSYARKPTSTGKAHETLKKTD